MSINIESSASKFSSLFKVTLFRFLVVINCAQGQEIGYHCNSIITVSFNNYFDELIIFFLVALVSIADLLSQDRIVKTIK
jgi:hypothetical protein